MSDDAAATCPICNKKLESHLGVYFHFLSCHKKELSICPICGKEFKDRSGLKQHLFRKKEIKGLSNFQLFSSVVLRLKGEEEKAREELGLKS